SEPRLHEPRLEEQQAATPRAEEPAEMRAGSAQMRSAETRSAETRSAQARLAETRSPQTGSPEPGSPQTRSPTTGSLDTARSGTGSAPVTSGHITTPQTRPHVGSRPSAVAEAGAASLRRTEPKIDSSGSSLRFADNTDTDAPPARLQATAASRQEPAFSIRRDEAPAPLDIDDDSVPVLTQIVDPAPPAAVAPAVGTPFAAEKEGEIASASGEVAAPTYSRADSGLHAEARPGAQPAGESPAVRPTLSPPVGAAPALASPPAH